MCPPLVKYPRTIHVEGSCLQFGDPKKKVPLRQLKGLHVVIEEKMDGSNSAVSLSPYGELCLQSRGHYLVGGRRETQFDMLKSMMHPIRSRLASVLGSRYVMFGEWLYARHTIFYDRLPSAFMEFDVYDRTEDCYLDTSSREVLLKPVRDAVVPVQVLFDGSMPGADKLTALVGPSSFASSDAETRRQNFLNACAATKCVAKKEEQATDLTGLMEGLYIKVEEKGSVTRRYKFVRDGFMQAVMDSNSHWMSRPTVRNFTL